jgi:hypothetical protein
MAGDDDDPARDWKDADPTVDVGVVEDFVDALNEPNTAPHDLPGYDAGYAIGHEEGLAAGKRLGYGEGRADVREEDTIRGIEAALLSAEEWFIENKIPGWREFLRQIRERIRHT